MAARGLEWGRRSPGAPGSLLRFDDGTGPPIYAGGSQAPLDSLHRLGGAAWTGILVGVSEHVIKLLVGGDHMQTGGSFTSAGGQPANHIAARSSCRQACGSAADFTNDGGVDGGDVSDFFARPDAAGC